MNAHTPGAWRLEDGGSLIWGNCDPEVATSYGYPVARCEFRRSWNHQHLPTDDEIKANARLIVASPDLLDALVGLVGLVELIIPTLEGSQKSAVQHNHRLTAARAAIAKAGAV